MVILLYIGSALPVVWGIAHLFPTKSVVRGFGQISSDNRHIIAMEWILEGVALIWLGSVVAAATFIDAASPVSRALYELCAVALSRSPSFPSLQGFG